jgi:hypothetical protein
VTEEHVELGSGDLVIAFTDGLNLDIDDVTEIGLAE